MRGVVQRVQDCAVTVDGRETGRIARGLLVYLGVGQEDTDADLNYLAEKVLNLRIFPDPAGRMNLSVLDTAGQVLVVSQFTLYGDARNGRRPSYSSAAEPAVAQTYYETFIRTLSDRGVTVAAGEFAARMEVRYTNVGPVTILLDSRKTF
jgi:D-tyrosyl-tRNA(Tyr) deacylase